MDSGKNAWAVAIRPSLLKEVPKLGSSVILCCIHPSEQQWRLLVLDPTSADIALASLCSNLNKRVHCIHRLGLQIKSQPLDLWELNSLYAHKGVIAPEALAANLYYQKELYFTNTYRKKCQLLGSSGVMVDSGPRIV